MKKQKVHLATLGFNEQGRIKYVLSKKGGDKLFLFYSNETKPDLARVSAEIRRSGSWDVEPILVDAWEYHDVLYKVVKVVVDNYNNEILFNPSLGTRVMTAALFAAANFTRSSVYLVKEDRAQNPIDIIEIEPVQRQTLSAPKKRVLEALTKAGDSGFSSMGALAKKVSLSRSAVSDHVKSFTSWGYTRTIEEKKEKQIYITPLGGVILEMAKLWSKKEKKNMKKQ